jgi:hypothetical protein
MGNGSAMAVVDAQVFPSDAVNWSSFLVGSAGMTRLYPQSSCYRDPFDKHPRDADTAVDD